MTSPKGFLDKVAQPYANLRSRWRDEHEYEDCHDYAQDIKKLCEEHDMMFLEMTYRPWRFKFEDPTGQRWEIRSQLRSMALTPIM